MYKRVLFCVHQVIYLTHFTFFAIAYANQFWPWTFGLPRLARAWLLRRFSLIRGLIGKVSFDSAVFFHLRHSLDGALSD